MAKKARRHYHHQHEKKLYRRLKITVLALFILPIAFIAMFVFLGPKVGTLFSFVSINRNDSGDQDTLPPPPPIFDMPPKAINKRTITISGFAEPGGDVKIFVNGPEVQSQIATGDGTFRFEGIELIKGNNSIFAKVTDENGNESEKSTSLSISVDDKAPDITIESPQDDSTVKNLNKRIFIRGSVSEKATVKVNDRIAILRPDLTFEFPLGVEEGWVEISVVAEDEAGNQKEEKFKVKYEKESE